MFTIQKSCRKDPKRTDSYYGPSWDKAGIRHLYQEQYEIREAAEIIAKQLSSVNPVGFVVVEVQR